MPATDQLLAFALASLVLVAVPGPAIVFMVTRCVTEGRRAGLASVAGIETGTLVHVLAAAVGLSALVASSPAALTAIRWGGVVYLVWLAVQALRARGATATAPELEPAHTPARAFRQGFTVELLNPKTALFFLAFLPQFVDAGHGAASLQVLVLGATFVTIAAVVDTTWVLAAGALRRRVEARQDGGDRLAPATAATYAALAVAAAAL